MRNFPRILSLLLCVSACSPGENNKSPARSAKGTKDAKGNQGPQGPQVQPVSPSSPTVPYPAGAQPMQGPNQPVGPVVANPSGPVPAPNPIPGVNPNPNPNPTPNPNPGPMPMLPPVEVAQRDVIVQLFNWPFKKITEEMPKLDELGYGQIHVSPPNLTIASDQWWGRYQPVDYRLIAGPLGSEAEFKAMIAAAHQRKIRIIVDLVYNHTYNTSSPLPKEAEELNKAQGPLFEAADYHQAFCITDYNDPNQVRNGRLCGGAGDTGLPDLDQNSARVLKAQRDFIARLNAMGVDGYRLDAVKHMDIAYFSKLLTNDLVQGKFVFGEIIADSGSFDRDLAPYLVTPMGFYDFPLRATIQGAFGFGASLGELLDKGKLVSQKRALPDGKGIGFIMNHDIPNNDGFRVWILDPTDEMLANAYLLGRDGTIPYIFSDLGKAGGGGIKDDRWAYGHRNEAIARFIKFHNHVQGEGMTTLYADACIAAFQRGKKGAMFLNKCGEAKKIPIAGKFTAAKLWNLETNTQVDAQADVNVPGRSAVALIVP